MGGNRTKVRSMNKSLIGRMRDNGTFFRGTAGVVLGIFVFVLYSPSALAAKEAIENPTTPTAMVQGETDEEKLAGALQSLKKNVAAHKRIMSQRMQQERGLLEKTLNVFGINTLDSEPIAEINALNDNIVRMHESALTNFNALEAKLKGKGLPTEIMQRHYDAVEEYRAKFDDLQSMMNRLQTADSLQDQEAAAKVLDEFLQSQRFKPQEQPFDPNNLPNQSLKPIENNEPKTTKDEFDSAGLYDNPRVMIAAAGDFTFDKLLGADNPDYLEETVEVVFSDAVKAKAAELEHDPVKIYHWVLNNIEWLPTWGAIQDADLTLGSRQGNAFDISSLLIALLRESGIPSRYVHGTIEVPAEAFKNWVGGFNDIIAAGTFAASGSVPAVGVEQGGTVTKVRMEHIWVEAAIDYEPSRGAVNLDADTWIRLDPSFKQYEFLEETDPIDVSGIDAATATQPFLDSGTVNDAESWAAGFDSNLAEAPFTQVNESLRAFIDNNLDVLTVGDLFGGGKVIIKNFPSLPSALSNPVIVEGTRYAEIPGELQHKVSLALKTDFFLGTLIDPVTLPWPQVNSNKVTLSFKPATPADENAIRALFPAEGITDVSQIPSSIPAYLINVVPEIKVDGETILQSDAVRLGTGVPLSYRIESPRRSPVTITSPIPAGSNVALAIMAGGVSPTRLEDVQGRLESINSIIDSNDLSAFQQLDQEDLLGDRFYSGMLSYFAQYQFISQQIARRLDTGHLLAPSVGTFGFVPNVTFFFGVPRTVGIGGIAMDLDRIATITVNKNGDDQVSRNTVLQIGFLASTLEHAIPEQLYSSPEARVEAISAVKALKVANNAGQRVYLLTPENRATTLPNINHDSATINAIRNALDAGKHIITHTDAVSIPGWTGAGYIIFDPEVGDGGYLISGGANGGFFSFLVWPLLAVSAALLWLLVLFASAAVVASASLLIGAAIAVTYLALITAIGALVKAIVEKDFDTALNELSRGINYAGALLAGIALLSVFIPLGTSLLLFSILGGVVALAAFIAGEFA